MAFKRNFISLFSLCIVFTICFTSNLHLNAKKLYIYTCFYKYKLNFVIGYAWLYKIFDNKERWKGGSYYLEGYISKETC